MARPRLALMLALLMWSCPAASDDAANSETKFFIQRSEGEIAMCGIEFTRVYRDAVYRQGGAAILTGSLAWMEASGNIGLLLKIGGADLSLSPNGAVEPLQFAIPGAYISVDERPLHPTTRYQCERPQAFCGAYFLPTSMEIETALFSGRIAVAFNRTLGGLEP